MMMMSLRRHPCNPCKFRRYNSAPPASTAACPCAPSPPPPPKSSDGTGVAAVVAAVVAADELGGLHAGKPNCCFSQLPAQWCNASASRVCNVYVYAYAYAYAYVYACVYASVYVCAHVCVFVRRQIDDTRHTCATCAARARSRVEESADTILLGRANT